MEEFKQQFINVAYSEFGIKAIESINFEQAFAILDKMQQLRIHHVAGQSEQLPILERCECEEPKDEPIKICMNCNGYIEQAIAYNEWLYDQ